MQWHGHDLVGVMVDHWRYVDIVLKKSVPLAKQVQAAKARGDKAALARLERRALAIL